MASSSFPPVENADSTGIIAIGGDLSVERLVEAYSSGIFPWPFTEQFMAWFAPPKRAVLFLKDYHPSTRLMRIIKQKKFEIKIDNDFFEVINACAESRNRTGQSGTWITPEMIAAYCELHEAGYAHSFECYMDGVLCGGVYGVAVNGMFAGESMFYLKPYASQIAFWHLVEILKTQGVEWLDCQVMTAHSRNFGAVEISRKEFMKLLKKALSGSPLTFG